MRKLTCLNADTRSTGRVLKCSWCMRSASCTTLHPGVLHFASAGDVYQLAARRRYPRHGAWNDLDRLGVRSEGVDAVIGVGVAQNKAVIGLVCCAEDVGR